MTGLCFSPLLYSLEDTCPVPWTEATEVQLHHDYSFLQQDDSDENFVIRRYLETLWLPESVNAISHLIVSLRRIGPPHSCSTSEPHPLHSLLQPLLLSTRAASDKYRTELVQILADGGGAGEQEETMMWYALEYEKSNNEEGDVDEEKWRKAWLDRLERRETMIQILLNMLKISLPGPNPKPSVQEKPTKRKKNSKHDLPPETDEGRLESYMDKIAVWQLTAFLDGDQQSSQAMTANRERMKTDRHWTHVFYEDVVEPIFKAALPEQIALFRSKLFPESPFSDVEDSETESLMNGGPSRAGSRAPSISRGPLIRVPSSATSSRPVMQRSRSRSLSVSLARDEVSQRASFVAPKHALSREVSMSRMFRERPKMHARPTAKHEERKVDSEKAKMKRDMGMTLVEETPVKRRCADLMTSDARDSSQASRMEFVVPSPPPTSSSDAGEVLIGDTPFVTRRRQSGVECEATVPALSLAVDNAHPVVPVVAKNSKTKRKKTAAAATTTLSRAALPRAGTNASNSSQIRHVEGEADENADESYMDAFSSTNVTQLGHFDDQPTVVSPSPATRTRKGALLSTGLEALELRPKDGKSVSTTVPTKRRTRRK